MQLFGSAMCSPNGAPVNERWSAAACCRAKGFTPRCQSVLCLYDEDGHKVTSGRRLCQDLVVIQPVSKWP